MHSSKDIAQALVDALDRGVDPKELSEKLEAALMNSSQGAQVKQILFYLKEYSRRAKLRSLCRIESATPLNEREVKEIQSLVGANDEEVDTSINESLLAGFRVRYGDVYVDKTLASRLEKLRDAVA